jgi:hypothetical protein
MDFLFIIVAILGFILISLAFIGCILPALPGPPISFLSLIILKLAEPNTFTNDFLLIMGIITVIVFGLDYLLLILGAKVYNASRQGIWFSVIGMIIGIFFFPPFGMIMSLLLGAIIGELLAGKAKSEALKIGIVSFIFSILAIVLKLILVTVMAFYFTKAVFQYYV